MNAPSVQAPVPRSIATGTFHLKLATRMAGLCPTFDPSGHTIVFTHVPKTGGTTLDHILKAVAAVRRKKRARLRIPRGAPLPEHHNQELLNLVQTADDQVPDSDYLSGHFPFGIHRQLTRPCLYVTLLRDPVARLVSNFRFGLSRNRWSHDTPVSALIERGRLIDNVQTRQIAGISNRDVPCTPKTLANAIDNIQLHYAVVGLTERFDETLKTLITLLGWPDIAYSDLQVSRVPIEPEFESKVRDAAQRYFAFDLELYAAASARATPWNARIFEGTVTGNARQDTVLVTSSMVRVYGRKFCVVPRPIFDTQFISNVQQRGGEVVFV